MNDGVPNDREIDTIILINDPVTEAYHLAPGQGRQRRLGGFRDASGHFPYDLQAPDDGILALMVCVEFRPGFSSYVGGGVPRRDEHVNKVSAITL